MWDAVQDLESKFALKRLYDQGLRVDGSDITYLARFFTSAVGITDCTWEVYIDELKTLKESDCEDIDIISGIYTALDALRSKTYRH